MINKIICVLLLFIYIILIYLVLKEIEKNKFSGNNTENFQLFKTTDISIENFEDKKIDKWNDSPEKIDASEKGLNKTQKEQVKNMLNVKVDDSVRKSLNKNVNGGVSGGQVGQMGERGPAGPAGGEYIASGLLINKKYSFDDNGNLNMITNRVHGEGDSGKAFLDSKDLFSPTRYWYLHKDGNLKNRYDNMCLTTNGKSNSDLFMSECSDSPNQKWEWNNKSNRLILKDDSGNSSLQKCISLTGPKVDANTQLAGCTNNSCGDKHKRFLNLKDCNSSVQLDEVWSFN